MIIFEGYYNSHWISPDLIQDISTLRYSVHEPDVDDVIEFLELSGLDYFTDDEMKTEFYNKNALFTISGYNDYGKSIFTMNDCTLSDVEKNFGQLISKMLEKRLGYKLTPDNEFEILMGDFDVDWSEPESVNKAAKLLCVDSEFYPGDAHGYVLTDGTFIYDKYSCWPDEIMSKERFMMLGNFRIDENCITLAKVPQNAQKRAIRAFVSYYCAESIRVVMCGSSGEILLDVEVDKPNCSYLIERIERFFTEGGNPFERQ